MKTYTHANHKFTNALALESSPYLLQHAHNPVNWHPWGNEALEKAQRENKLILVSIGYSACHWCHVMEHESFENEEVAEFMNAHYVAIKVDREERPDIDQVYMNAVQLLSGQGGWPLNCIALPDGRPIYGGTYFPKDQWVDVLQQVDQFVKQNPEKAEHQATMLTQGVQASELVATNNEVADFTILDLDTLFTFWKSRVDYTYGGHKGAPKFPLPVGHQFLMHYHHLTQNKDALNAVLVTLNNVANGGIYDQIGGGFARYSVDAVWKVPHFEKMLYDNAQLVSLYSVAFQQTKDPKYKQIVLESLEFVKRELTSPEGGFYSALDADSDGVEGKFYVWTHQELVDILGTKANLIIDYYGVTKNGNWEEGNNILLVSENGEAIAHKYKITSEELDQTIFEAKLLLLQERSKRVRPALDDKILTSWNGLMLKGYVDSYRAFGDEAYLQIAIRNAEFILTQTKSSDHRLNRNFKNGKSTINAFLDDYASVIEGFIALYQATFNEKWLIEAHHLTQYTLAHFYNDEVGMFYYTSDLDPALIARKMEVADNVTPSANSQMAKNLYLLGHYFYNDGFIAQAKRMVANVKEQAINSGAYYANWDILMAWFASEPYEVAVVGNDFENVRKQFDTHYLPNVFLSGGKSEGTLTLLKGKLITDQTTIYVCRNRVCNKPTVDFDEAMKSLI